MNKEQAIAKIKELEQLIEDIDNINKTGAFGLFKPKKGEEFYTIEQSYLNGKFKPFTRSRNANGNVSIAFKDEKSAQRAADKLNLWMELSVMEGARSEFKLEEDYYISYDAKNKAWAIDCSMCISGMLDIYFDTEEQAEKACEFLNKEDPKGTLAGMEG